jgi:outer membrane protein assembly factor BamA
MGGVDNWLFPKYEQSNNPSTQTNYSFQALATNMRGFKQNIRNGSTFAAASVEIRVPIVSYIANRPIRSDFLNNLLLMPFFDVGTAWTGSGPYSDENTFNQKIIEVQNLKATVINVREPIIAGFGPGLRSKLMGYYVRLDIAWGIQDYEVAKKPIYHFSLSMDF